MKKSARNPQAKTAQANVIKEAVVALPKTWCLIGTLWALFIFFYYMNRFPLSWDSLSSILSAMTDFTVFHGYMLKALFGFTVAVIFLTLMARGGALLIQEYVEDLQLSTHERWVLGATLSAGLIATLVLGIGAAHLWNAGVFIIIGVSIVLWEISLPLKTPTLLPPPKTAWSPVWKLLLIALAALYLVGAAGPEIFYDSLHYHLAVPNLYRLAHRVYALPTLFYADFVMSVQMLYGVMITVGNTLSAKALHVGFSVLLGMGYLAFSRRFFGTASGWLAAALFFSLPMVAINATTAGMDVAAAFFLFASGVAIVLALERPALRQFQLAGALTGIAAGTKYPAFVFIPLAIGLLAWHFTWDQKKPWREWIGFLLHFSGAALLFLSPILIKNVVFHGNPLFPFGGAIMGHPKIDPQIWHKFIVDTSPRDWPAMRSSPMAFLRFIFAPWFITFDSQGTLGPVLLMALPFFCRRSKQSLAYTFFQRYSVLLWGVWICTSTVPRYALPALVLFCPVVAEAVLSVTAGWGMRWLLWSSLALGIAANSAMQLMILFSWDGWQVVAGKVSEDVYLSHQHTLYPTPPYEAYLWMNQNLPAPATVLIAGEARSYYLNRRSIPSSIPGPQAIVQWSHEAKSGAELAQKMRTAGVTHIFLNLIEALRTDSYREFVWDPASWTVLDDFWSHNTRLIWKKENQDRADYQALYVFELLPDAIAAQPHPPSPNPFIHWKPNGAI